MWGVGHRNTYVRVSMHTRGSAHVELLVIGIVSASVVMHSQCVQIYSARCVCHSICVMPSATTSRLKLQEAQPSVRIASLRIGSGLALRC